MALVGLDVLVNLHREIAEDQIAWGVNVNPYPLVARQVTGKVELLRAHIAFVLLLRVCLVNENMRVESSAVLEDFPAKLANLFSIIAMNVLVMELKVSFVEELALALRAGDWILELFLRILFLLARRVVQSILFDRRLFL